MLDLFLSHLAESIQHPLPRSVSADFVTACSQFHTGDIQDMPLDLMFLRTQFRE